MTADLSPARRPSPVAPNRALLAACVGNAVEWYDFALFGAAAAILAEVITPGSLNGFVTVFAVFATSCLFRPLGSLLIGLRADRVGRGSVLVGTILGMSLATFAIGVLPTWSAVGLLAPVLLLTLRAVQAFSAGGEIGVAVTYLMEISPSGARGRIGGWYLATVAVGLAAGLAVTVAVAAVSEPTQHLAWTWRIPFLLALPLGLAGLYLRLHRLGDTVAREAERAPLRVTIRRHGRSIRRCFALGAAYSTAFNLWFVFLPTYLIASGTATLIGSLSAALAGMVAVSVTAPVFGHWSDRIGRRRVLIGAATALVVAALPSYLLLRTGSGAGMLAGYVLMGVVLGAFPLPAFFADQFPTSIRATGIGLSYGISSALIGGTAPLLAVLFAQRVWGPAIPLYAIGWSVLAVVAVIRTPVEPAQTRRLPAGLADRSPRLG